MTSAAEILQPLMANLMVNRFIVERRSRTLKHFNVSMLTHLPNLLDDLWKKKEKRQAILLL